jgi:predicted DCC family thiol-disulfide oxidoreductase YuxK
MPTRIVVYDGGCGLCSRSAAVLSRVDWLKKLSFADVTADWERLCRDHPTLSRDACLAEMHVVTGSGRIVAGFDGCRALAAVLPLGWLFLPFLHFPGVAPVGRRLYRALAARRKTTTCMVPQAR